MRDFALMLIAMVLIFVFALPVLVISSVFRKNRKKYWRSVAIGFDQVGGSLLYGTEDWTISSWTYHKCIRYGKLCWFEKFINFIFGDGHCERSYKKEKMEGLI